MFHRDREQGRAGKARAKTEGFIEYDPSRIASGSGPLYTFESTYGSGPPESVIDPAQMAGPLYTFDSTESSDGSGLLLPPASAVDTVSSRSSGIGAWLDGHETYTDMGSTRGLSPLPVDSPFIDCLPDKDVTYESSAELAVWAGRYRTEVPFISMYPSPALCPDPPVNFLHSVSASIISSLQTFLVNFDRRKHMFAN